MKLDQSVNLKGNQKDFSDYCNDVTAEQNHFAGEFLDSKKEWIVPKSLTDKIDPSGKLLPFYGDTIVCTLNQQEIDIFAALQKTLRSSISFLANPLDINQFHMTVHDLANDIDITKIHNKMNYNQQACKKLFAKLSEYLKSNDNQTTVTMNSTVIYPAVSTAILVGFIPASEKDYTLLLNIYNLFDEIHYLDYWPRFHVTLDYLKPFSLSNQEKVHLKNSLQETCPKQFSIQLNLKEMVYQHFSDMNSYSSLFSVSDC